MQAHGRGWRSTGTVVWRGLVLAVVLGLAVPLQAQVGAEEHADRRAELAHRVEGGIVLAMGAAAPPQDYIPFHQESVFRYLTGFTEPDAGLILEVVDGRISGEFLFVLPRDPATETWEGYRVGPDGTREATGIPGRDIQEMQAVFDSLVQAHGSPSLHLVGPHNPRAAIRNDVTQRIEALLDGHGGLERNSANHHVAELRGVKSEGELELLRRSIAITVQAHREMMGAMAPGMHEFELQSLIEYTFRRYGSERPAFASIVGSGPNSTILHYNANDRFMDDGDVVVVDIGASYGGYAADVTRTVPVNGRFSPEQREIYQLVRDAQAAAEELAAPGVPFSRLSQRAARVLAEGLADLGLIQAPDATFDGPNGRELPQLILFYMHGLGHGIGLDVHDPWPPVLEPGVAFTIEPGIYVRPNLFSEVVPDSPRNRRMMEAIRPAFEKYVNIGVRIEDDYFVTSEGVEWISTAPREIEEIEELMARPWDGPADRNPQWIEWYRDLK